MAHLEEFGRLIGGSREAVEDTPQTAGVRFEGGEGIRPAVALVDDHVEAESDGQIQLLLKEDGLAVFQVGIGQEGLLGARGGAAGGLGGILKGGFFAAGEVVIVEATFAEGHDFGVAGQLLELVTGVLGGFGHLTGVDADGGVDVGVGFGQGDGGLTGLEVGADGDQAGDPGVGGPADDRLAVGIEIGEVEVTVGVDEHFNLRLYSGQRKNKGD